MAADARLVIPIAPGLRSLNVAPQPLVAAEPLWGTRQGQEHPLLLTREIARNDSAESRPG